jgi:hypothetical protein
MNVGCKSKEECLLRQNSKQDALSFADPIPCEFLQVIRPRERTDNNCI